MEGRTKPEMIRGKWECLQASGGLAALQRPERAGIGEGGTAGFLTEERGMDPSE